MSAFKVGDVVQVIHSVVCHGETGTVIDIKIRPSGAVEYTIDFKGEFVGKFLEKSLKDYQ